MSQEGKPSGTIKQACDYSGLNRNQIYELLASGEVLSAKIGPRKRIIDFPSLRQAVARRMKPGIDPELSAEMAARRRGAK